MSEMDDASQTITIYLIDGFALMSFASVVEPLRAANLLAGRDLYDIQTIPVGGDEAVSSGSAVIRRAGGQGAPDLALVVAGGDPFASDDPGLLADLRKLDDANVTLGGVSGGPVVLARAGLMAGRRMTVHWEHAPALAELHPELLIERNLFVIDRDRVTCAGGTAPIDMMHNLVAQRHGAAFAREVSDWFLHTDVRLAGDPQRAGLQERLGVTSRPLLDAIEMMETHIADPLSLKQIAEITGVSPRQLNRMFQAKLSRSTMAFYRNLRLERARRLLMQTPLTLGEVAEATGFSAMPHFSRAYRTVFGVSPSTSRTGPTMKTEAL